MAVVDDVPEACVVVVVDEGVLGDTVDDADVGGCTVVVGVSIESAAADDVGVVVGPPGAGTDVAAEGIVVSAAGWLLTDVVGRPDAEWGERVTAVVVPADPADPPSLELLRTHVRRRLPRYASPSELVLTESIPVLPSGKPDLDSLRRARTLRGREQSPARSVN